MRRLESYVSSGFDAREAFERRAAAVPAPVDVPVASEVPGRAGYGWIPFTGLPNTRDLGGLPAADDRTIRSGMLLRSGALGFARGNDLQRLHDEYHLQLVVDLRNDDELAELPDPMDAFPGARFVHANILTEQTVGITQEKEAKALAKLEAASRDRDPVAFMTLLYPHMLLEDSGIAGYRLLFQALLACEQGAALWHCYVGRDRCGIASALVEAALGVPEQEMLADYLATNVYAPAELTASGPADTRLFMAVRDAAEREFGGFLGYITDALAITRGEIHDLRLRYLA